MAFAALTVDLNARLAKFEQDMARASKSMDGFSARASAAAAGIKSAFSVAAAGLSVGALATFAKSGIDASDALNDMSARLGVSVKDLASFKLAADQSGTSLEGVGTGIARLSKSIGEAEGGNKNLAIALKELGITARDPKEAFFQLADAVQRIEDPNKRAALLSQVLGKSYADLVPLLSQGSQALRDSAAASETFAEQMAKLAPDADRFNDQLEVLKTNAAGAAATLLNELVPALNEVFERTSTLAELYAAGGVFNTLVTTAGARDYEEVLARVRREIKLTEEAVAGKKAAGRDSSAFEEKLRGLNAQLQVLLERKVKALSAPPDTEYDRWLKERRAAEGRNDRIDLPSTAEKSGKGIDKLATWADEMQRGLGEAADEAERLAGDLQFMAEVDLSQGNGVNEYAKQWEEAGRALEDAMRTPLERANLELGRLDELLARGAINWETYSRATFKVFDDLEEPLQTTKSLAEEIGLTFTSAFEDAIVAGGDFSDVLKGLEQDIARILIRRTVTEPLTNALGSIDLSSIFSSFLPSANGNAFLNAPALSAYSGSVVSRPTVFPFANGIGLMGEAGAEAILPLKRGADGKLGVAGGGSSVQVNVINNASGTRATANEREEGGVRIIDVIVEQVEGNMGRRIARGEGLAPGLERRYGLNAVAGGYR